jgi:branched-chain amino acid transport system permease protein
MAGQVNLGLVGFFAVGAYASALLTLKLGVPIAVGVLASALAAAAVGAVVSLVTARLRGDYLAIVTLGFAEAIRIAASNEIWLTNGTDGLSGIPGPWRAALSPEQFNLFYLCLIAALVTVIFALIDRLGYSPFGRVLRAIRDDEQAASVAGKHTLAFKVKAFAFGSAVLGLAGALYGHYTSYIAPDLFLPLLTLYITLALLVGGVGNNRGAVLGGVVVVTFLESTRFLVPLVPGLTHVQGAALRELMISAALIVVLRLRPQGLVPEERAHPVLATEQITART